MFGSRFFAVAALLPVASSQLCPDTRGKAFCGEASNASSASWSLGSDLNEADEGKAHEGTSFCAQGQQLPQLYVLGTQKAASSSLAEDLINAGVLPALQDRALDASMASLGCWSRKGGCGWKEFHFWDTHLVRQGNETQQARQQMLRHMPACKAEQAVADFTPNNLGLVPFPEGTAGGGTHYGQGSRFQSKSVPVASVNLPKVLRSVYESAAAEELIFAVTLRSPLPRMHSAYYHAKSLNFTGVCTDCESPSFVAALEKSVAKAEQSPPDYDDWIWRSLVGLQLQEWLGHFSPRQFVVIPFLTYSRDLSGKVCQRIADNLGSSIKCKPKQSSHANARKHPRLQEEPIPAKLLSRFNAIMEPFEQQLVETLAAMELQGADLFGYDGKTGSSDDVNSWLRNNWGSATISAVAASREL